MPSNRCLFPNFVVISYPIRITIEIEIKVC
jgi:hypothetical protein